MYEIKSIKDGTYGAYEYSTPIPADYSFKQMLAMARDIADGLYSREEPYGGAAEALNQLHDAGWNVIMATSRADDWRGESQRWLHRNGFQFDGYYNGDKTLLTPDVLIDDRPVTLEAMAAKGVTVLHPDHAYCTAAPGRMFHRWAAVPLILGGVR